MRQFFIERGRVMCPECSDTNTSQHFHNYADLGVFECQNCGHTFTWNLDLNNNSDSLNELLVELEIYDADAIADIEKTVTPPKFKCTKYGYRTDKFSFICPKCHTIESFLPYL